MGAGPSYERRMIDSPGPRRLRLVRHAESVGNVAALDAEQRGAEEIVYASPYARTQQTALELVR